jgi:hypothetical protein
MSKLYVSADSDTVKTLKTARGHHRASAHARGWDTGARVEVQLQEDGRVSVYVWRTGGSNGANAGHLFAHWTEDGPLNIYQQTAS